MVWLSKRQEHTWSRKSKLLQLCKGFNSHLLEVSLLPSLLTHLCSVCWARRLRRLCLCQALSLSSCCCSLLVWEPESADCYSDVVISWVHRRSWAAITLTGDHGQLGGSDSKQLDIHLAPSRWEYPGLTEPFQGPSGKATRCWVSVKILLYCWR